MCQGVILEINVGAELYQPPPSLSRYLELECAHQIDIACAECVGHACAWHHFERFSTSEHLGFCLNGKDPGNEVDGQAD